MDVGGGHVPDVLDVPGDEPLPAPDDAPPLLGGLQPVFEDAIAEEVVRFVG